MGFDEYGNYKYPDYSNSQYTNYATATGGTMMGMTIDDKKRNIRLTAKKNGLGFVSASKYCCNNYRVINVFDIYTSLEKASQDARENGMYQIIGYMYIPCRIKEVCISLGFDRYGDFQTWEVNYGRGNIPKKYKEEMFDTLCQWAIKDGWLEEAEWKVTI